MKQALFTVICALAVASCGGVVVAEDPCSTNQCRNGSICVAGDGPAYSCECLAGFEGQFCQNDADDCADAPCLNDGVCVDGADQYTCECAPGWSGMNCQTADPTGNPCTPNPCKNGGVCAAVVDTFTCDCSGTDGYSGALCDVPPPVDVCSPNPCQNGGTCSVSGDSFACDCASSGGFTGDLCDVPPPADPCEPNPCANGGACSGAGETFACECVDGYSGALCDVPPSNDPCDPSPCQNGGFCSGDGDGFNCACATGYEGSTCATEIDECADMPCQNDAQCTDQIGGFECQCPAGYTGDVCEIAPGTTCADEPCKNGATCANAADSFTCDCAPGYEGATCATDIDDCADAPCGQGGSCIDGVNSFGCECKDGWSGAKCECQTAASTVCKDGSVVAFDSCGGAGEVVQTCSACAPCITDDAGAMCDPLGCDAEAPKLLSVTLTPSAVDVTSGPADVLLRFEATDDLTGVGDGPCQADGFLLSSPSFGQQAKTSYCQKKLVEGTATSGTWEVTLTIPKFAESGTWKLGKLMLADVAGNQDSGALQAAGLSASVQVSSTPDTKAPVLVSAGIAPKAIDVTVKSQEITVTFKAQDDLSGVGPTPCQSKGIAVVSPTGLHHVGVSYCQKMLVAGTANDGTWEAVIEIPPFVEKGTWRLSNLMLADEAGNIDYSALDTAGLETVTFDVASITDAVPPTLKSASISPSVVDVSTGDATVTLTYAAADELSGVGKAPCQADAFFLVARRARTRPRRVTVWPRWWTGTSSAANTRWSW